MIKRAALYIRVSTDKQVREGDSISAQIEALRRYVDDHDDLVLADEYIDDGISGRKFKERDELQRMLEDVRAKKIDLILFTKLDRFYRSIRHYTATQEVLDKYGVTWLAIWEPIYDTTTPSGRLIVNQMMSIAQFEAENTGQRIKQVFEYKISNGEVVSGSCPPGLSIKDKHLVPNDDAHIVRDMFEYYARTNNLRQLVLYLEAEYGFIRTQGNIRNYLTNPLYKGEYRGNKGYCEAIVSEELWDTVQRLLSHNIRCSTRHEYIFTGMVICAECGRKMRANYQSTISRRKDGSRVKKHYSNYACWSAIAYHRCDNNRCITERVIEKELLRRVSGELREYVINYDVESQKRKNVDGKIKALEGKIGRLKELFVNGLISLEELKSDIDRYQTEIDDLRAESIRPGKDLSELRAFLDLDFEKMYSSLSIQEKRQIWQSIIKEIRFDKDRNLSFVFL